MAVGLNNDSVDYLTIASVPSTGTMSLGLWVFFTSATPNTQIITDMSKSTTGAAEDSLFMDVRHSTTQLRAGTFDFSSSTQSNTTLTAVPTSAWVFLAYSKSTTSLTAYMRGEGAAAWSSQNVSVTDPLVNIDFFWIGRSVFGGDGLQARIAHMRVWEAALTEAEWTTEWNCTTAQRAANLWAEWRFVNAAGAATDSSGNGRSLTVNGTLSDEADPVIRRYPKNTRAHPLGVEIGMNRGVSL